MTHDADGCKPRPRPRPSVALGVVMVGMVVVGIGPWRLHAGGARRCGAMLPSTRVAHGADLLALGRRHQGHWAKYEFAKYGANLEKPQTAGRQTHETRTGTKREGVSSMTEAIVWKHATEDELATLADRHSVDDCKRDLAQIFELDTTDEKKSFLLDFHLHNYSFSRQQHFQLDQTSVFLGMCQTLMERDFAHDSVTDLQTSFAFFQSLLLTHSVNRSPKSVGIFSRQEVEAIVDYVTHSYYRHFQLYKCIYTPYYHVHLVQRQINDVQMPRRPRPLTHGVLHAAKPRPQSSAQEREHQDDTTVLTTEKADEPAEREG